MILRASLIAIGLLAAPAWAASPIAEVLCAPTEKLEEDLVRRHGVTRQWLGLRDPDSRMELWSSDTTGDWTLVVAYATGKSCIVDMGHYWEESIPDPA